MAAGLNFAGAMISTKVATTIGKGIVDKDVTQMVVLAGVIGAIIWDLVTWYYGLPSSSSHAIIGGIMVRCSPMPAWPHCTGPACKRSSWPW